MGVKLEILVLNVELWVKYGDICLNIELWD